MTIHLIVYFIGIEFLWELQQLFDVRGASLMAEGHGYFEVAKMIAQLYTGNDPTKLEE